MSDIKSWLALTAVVVCVTLPNVSWARSSLDTRLERLENIIDNQVNVNLLSQLDAMQQEVQELRGKIEEQQHELLLLNQKQEKLYLNLDSRLGSINKPAIAESTVDNTSDLIDQIAEKNLEVAPALVPTSSGEPIGQSEKSSYDAAYRLMNSKQYTQAIAAFRQLLVQYPAGTFAPNVYYWLGEIYAAEWQQNRSDTGLIKQANEAFTTVTIKYPQHHKAVDALLKLGLLEFDQEHWANAKQILTEVVQKYPGSSRARLAEAKLQRIQQ